MDPATIAVGFGMLGSFVSKLPGVIVNRVAATYAHDASRLFFSAVRERLHDGELPVNHDLSHAVQTSLLQAARAFAYGVAAQLGPNTPLFDAMAEHFRNKTFCKTPILEMRKVPGHDWVRELLDETERCKDGIADFVMDENRVNELLLRNAPEEFSAKVRDSFREWLGRRVQNAPRPSCVDDFLNSGWRIAEGRNERVTFYEAFALFFQDKVKHNQAVFNILIAQTLSQLVTNQNKTVDDPELRAEFDKWLAGLANIEIILKRIEDKVGEIATKQDTLLAGQKETDSDVKEIKKDVNKLLTTPQLISFIHQLQSAPNLVGRDEVLVELEKKLTTTHTAGATISASVQGMGGIGKTALVVALAHRLKGRYPDAQLFLNLRGADPEKKLPLPPESVMESVIHAFYPTAKLPEGLTALTPIYRSVLSEAGSVLLILDNAAGKEQVEPLLPPGNCLLLVTSRSQFHLPDVVSHNLNCLEPGRSQELLLKRAERIDGLAVKAAELCGHLPLALEVFAGVVNDESLVSIPNLIKRLRKQTLKLDAVHAAFQVSYDILSEDLRRHWTLLSVFSSNFDIEAAAAVWNGGKLPLNSEGKFDPDPATEIMQKLVNASLVACHKESLRFYLHDLVRQFCEGKLTETERSAARLNHARHYCNVADSADQLYKKGGENMQSGLALFDRERAHIEAAFAFLSASFSKLKTSSDTDQAKEYATTLIALVNAVTYTSNLRFHPRQRIQWFEFQLESARFTIHRKAEGNALGNLGLAYADLGEPRKAIEFYEKALLIDREIGDRRGEGADLGNLGLAYADLGEPRKAIEFYEKQLGIVREIGDRRGEGNALGNLGVAYRTLGELRKAIEFYEKQLVIAREIGGRRGEGNALWNSALSFWKLDNHSEAIDRAGKALAIFEAIEDSYAAKVRATLEEWKNTA